ncbi:hypothetical protein ENSA5_05590 [Enhygromyxa salina]|uniref:Uncharacterized protein n=1 Tax=Enhygromyxa salina TaxID=215803 RepID=A0A2S9YI09_9BACT|nr:hypothetical protein [Enhygromyxa salina]PRQ04710.1 hypothetical protein ENSA5_05590 [Enhygromyxa salina]
MRSLISLLEEAARRSASEVTLESGQPVVYTTARGAEAETSVLPRGDLFDMIVAAVNDAQQVELAVGNPVEFSVDTGEGWTVYAEPGMEGITVRAQREGGLEIDLDDSAGAAGGGGGGGPVNPVNPVGEARGEGAPEPVPARDSQRFDASEPDLGAGRGDGVPIPLSRESSDALVLEDPALDVGLLDAPALDQPVAGGDYDVLGPDPAPNAFESGTWALDDDEELAVGLDSDSPEDSIRAGLTPPAPAMPGDYEEFIGVPEDDDEDVGDGYDPFAAPAPDPDIERRRTLSPTVRAMDASPPPVGQPVGQVEQRQANTSGSWRAAESEPAGASPKLAARGGAVADGGPVADDSSPATTDREQGAVTPAQAATRRELSTVASPGAVTLREFSNFGHGESELNELTASIAEGVLVYIREPGFADTLAHSFKAPSVVIDDQLDPAEVWTRVRGLPPGAIVIVRCEDPSRLLGWILRRLEEGYRVFVETRARTHEGARRMLLGISATALGERWLDSQVALTIEPGEGGPRLVQP